jgi:hypothetical protein
VIRRALTRISRLFDRRYAAFYGRRFVLHPSRRRIAAAWVAKRRPRTANFAPSDSAITAVAELDRDGHHVLAPPLTPAQLDDITTHLMRHTCRDPYRPELGSFDPTTIAPQRTHVAFYSPEVVASCPHVFGVANAPHILEVVERYLGCKPTIGYVAAWWSLKGHAQGEHAELFHRDVDDWRFLKLFVYLTDVDDEAGPHAFVSGSQSVAKLLRIGRYADDQVIEVFGPDAIRYFRGPRGTAFLEDTFGLHKGSPPKYRNRLVLQVVYSLGELPYGPRRPFDTAALPPSVLGYCLEEPYVNRVYLHTHTAAVSR